MLFKQRGKLLVDQYAGNLAPEGAILYRNLVVESHGPRLVIAGTKREVFRPISLGIEVFFVWVVSLECCREPHVQELLNKFQKLSCNAPLSRDV